VIEVKWWHVGLLISLFIGGFLSLFASPLPDGLERVAEDLGFIELEQSVVPSPLPDYSLPGIESPISGSIAGIVGVLLMFGVVWGVANILKGRNEHRK